MVEGETQMPGKNKEGGSGAAVGEKQIVIIIGKKKCPPKRKGGF